MRELEIGMREVKETGLGDKLDVAGEGEWFCP